MWHDMFAQQIPFAEKIIRTVLVYVLIAVLLRATGKRGLSGLNSLDIVVMVLLSNVVQNAVIGSDNSVVGGAIGAVTLVAINAAVNRAALRSDRISRVFDGSDTLLIDRGDVVERAARRIGSTPPRTRPRSAAAERRRHRPGRDRRARPGRSAGPHAERLGAGRHEG